MELLNPGTVLQDRYEVIRLIGQGGMGAVYEATDHRLRNRVALKQTLMSDPQLSRAFEREAQILANLRHPALVRVSDHFVDQLGQFLVMEFIPGEDLATLQARNNQPFPLDTVLIWADRLLDALEYLHTQPNPIIHRDIKPQNLKLTPRNEIILLDFGLAKGLATPFSQHNVPTGSIFGYTPKYAPLEQMQGTGTDARSDIYSLSATLYQLLTNTPPLDALQRAAAVLNQQPDPLPPVFAVNPQVSKPLSDVLMQGMALRAPDRFASANAMRRALWAAAQWQRPAAPPISVVPPAPQPSLPPPPHPSPTPQHPPSHHHRLGMQPPSPTSDPEPPRRFVYDPSSPPPSPSPVSPSPGQPGPAPAPRPPHPPSQPHGVAPTPGPGRPPTPPSHPPHPSPGRIDWGKRLGFSVLGCLIVMIVGFAVVFISLVALGRRVSEVLNEVELGLSGDYQARSTDEIIPAGWSLVLYDTFDDNVNGWGVGSYSDEFAIGSEEVSDGYYRAKATALKGFVRRMSLDSIGEFSDFALQVKARRVTDPLGGAEYGVNFRQSGSNYYLFSITDDGYYRASLMHDGSWSTLIDRTAEPAIRSGEENHITVVARGANFTFYINGKLVESITDTTLPRGGVGVLIGLDEGETGIFEFDDFTVYAPPAP